VDERQLPPIISTKDRGNRPCLMYASKPKIPIGLLRRTTIFTGVWRSAPFAAVCI
jgi:hypothetical protein